jgi:Ca2+-binding EF-hand superfamily protein
MICVPTCGAGDGSGTIDKEELGGLLEQMCVPVTGGELEALMETLDKDKSGSVDFDEFYDWCVVPVGEGERGGGTGACACRRLYHDLCVV